MRMKYGEDVRRSEGGKKRQARPTITEETWRTKRRMRSVHWENWRNQTRVTHSRLRDGANSRSRVNDRADWVLIIIVVGQCFDACALVWSCLFVLEVR